MSALAATLLATLRPIEADIGQQFLSNFERFSTKPLRVSKSIGRRTLCGASRWGI